MIARGGRGIFSEKYGGRGIFRMLLSALGKGSVGGGEAGGKAKMTPDAGGKSVSEKSQATPGLQGPPFRNQKVSRQNFSSVK